MYFQRDNNLGNSWSRNNKLHLFRFISYPLFILLMLCKITLIDHRLNIPYVNLSFLDSIIAIGSIMIVSFWAFWLPRGGYLISLVLLNLFLTAIMYSDLVYYRYFGDFITIPVLLQTGQISSLGDSIQSLIHWNDLYFFVDWVIISAYAIIKLIQRLRRNTSWPIHQTRSTYLRRKSILHRFITGILILVIGSVLTFAPIKYYSETWAKGVFESNWWNITLYNVTGILGFHGYDIYRYAQDHLGPDPTLPEEEMDAIKALFQQKSDQRSVQNEAFGKYKNSNVVVVQVEAFMNFMIGKSINGEEITPNFNKLMKESMYFSNYYHQTGQGRTSDADFSSHSSLHPLPSGSVFVRYPNHHYDMLPTILKEHGYSPNVFHAYDSSFWNRTIMYNNMGYDRFFSKKDFTIDEPMGWSLSDNSFFKQSLDEMTSITEPFYSFLITLSSHHPYTIPKDKQGLDVGEFSDNIFGNYLQSIHYVDDALGKFTEQMKKQGLWDNTILVVYGDHDNSIKDKPYYEQFLGKSLNDLDMEQIMNQVPLLVHLPDGSQVGEYSEPSGQLDMTPSLLHLLGIPTDSYHMLGNNLFAEEDRFVVLRSGAFSDNNVFYIPSPDGIFENGRCYDLNTREKTTVGSCRVGFDQAKFQLRSSDQVIQYDLLSKLDDE
ncbi:LTA synthase family protein [Paenibacillus antarcticus]|uniref:Phosphoglycerol transferase n=1 Tax=Paenibacillus antarcticus TaxID=253703 RepID=A0A168LNA3_9BACL|nr:LTA synthase family protein [Paenibacillus antarcticus]OAB43629.1 phosphoglycerol transferase [Paenibacillus antarcticus]